MSGAQTATLDDDRATVSRIAGGDSSALAALYDRHGTVAVTLEPAGRVAQPTSDPILAGSL